MPARAGAVGSAAPRRGGIAGAEGSHERGARRCGGVRLPSSQSAQVSPILISTSAVLEPLASSSFASAVGIPAPAEGGPTREWRGRVGAPIQPLRCTERGEKACAVGMSSMTFTFTCGGRVTHQWTTSAMSSAVSGCNPW
jgi:hypothetical protein